jgi:3-oxoacyl-[acyl-carrier protein] reductase
VLAIDLRGRRVLVTGSTSPIGRAIAARFAEAGADVVLHRRRAGVDGAADLPGPGRHTSIHGDLTDAAEVAAMFDGVAAGGPLHVLVNNAGTYPSSPLDEMTHVDWRSVVQANLDSTFLCTQAAARLMRAAGGGAVVNIASLSAHRPAIGQSHYTASKAAVIAFTRSAAVEYAPLDIRVNSVSPGLVHREGIEQQWPEGVARWNARVPLRRLGTGRDVADACVFLASPMASWITGQDLLVDGGTSAAPAF